MLSQLPPTVWVTGRVIYLTQRKLQHFYNKLQSLTWSGPLLSLTASLLPCSLLLPPLHSHWLPSFPQTSRHAPASDLCNCSSDSDTLQGLLKCLLSGDLGPTLLSCFTFLQRMYFPLRFYIITDVIFFILYLPHQNWGQRLSVLFISLSPMPRTELGTQQIFQ